MVSFDAGKNVDREPLKALFIPEAAIVLRASRTSMNVLNRNTFVDDFVRFIREARLEDQAFEETMVAIKTQETGDVARSTVHDAARVLSRERPAQHGIDVFLLRSPTVAGGSSPASTNSCVPGSRCRRNAGGSARARVLWNRERRAAL